VHLGQHGEGIFQVVSDTSTVETRVTNQPFEDASTFDGRGRFPQGFGRFREFQHERGRDEVLVVLGLVGDAELLEAVGFLGPEPLNLAGVRLAIDFIRVEAVEEPIPWVITSVFSTARIPSGPSAHVGGGPVGDRSLRRCAA
jgi:hypothetical protein